MKRIYPQGLRSGLPAWLALALALSPGIASAQYFSYSGKGDLLAGFRKPGVGAYELVVNLGNVTNLLDLAPGDKVPVADFTPAQLADAFSTLGGLQWSASATFVGAPNSTWAGYQMSTIWFTLPRQSAATQTQAPVRRSASSQAAVRSLIDSVGRNAHTISANVGATNADNNPSLVREPAAGSSSLSAFLGDPLDPTIGDFYGEMPTPVENTTPSSFTSAAVSDFYQSVPAGYPDPDTGAATGTAYYVGFFTLNPDGTMTFTRASSAAEPPAPQVVAVARSGNTSSIYFTTSAGSYTYSLYYTNSAGLAAPLTRWAALPGTITGDGTTNHFSDATTDADRFYRVGVH